MMNSRFLLIQFLVTGLSRFSFARETSMVFPDDPEYLKLENKSIQCSPSQALFNSKCETLFLQGSCDPGHHLIHPDNSPEPTCVPTKCRYPESVELDGTGECVVRRFHVCPDGMKLQLSRSGVAECDCKPGYLYYASHAKCYEAHTQGPCRRSQLFILPPQSIEFSGEFNGKGAQCVRNPCRRSDSICFAPHCPAVQQPKKDCVKLKSPCRLDEGNGILVVNPENLELECKIATFGIETRILSQVPDLICSPGSKRDISGMCRKTFKFSRKTREPNQ